MSRATCLLAQEACRCSAVQPLRSPLRSTPQLHRPTFIDAYTLWVSAVTRGQHVVAAHRTLRLARTIADLGHAELTGPAHLAEALQYRARPLL